MCLTKEDPVPEATIVPDVAVDKTQSQRLVKREGISLVFQIHFIKNSREKHQLSMMPFLLLN
jgi:hypothetical protein